MNYVKIELEEYNRLKKSHDALRAKKMLSIRASGMFSWSTPIQEYYTESEVISDLTNRINEFEAIIDKLKAESSMAKVEVKSKSFWNFLK